MNSKHYKDLYAFHPGYYVNQLIDELEITQEEFALRMGVSAKTISLLVRGETDLSEDMALKLSNMFGMSIDVWLNLQQEYSKKVLEIEKEQVLDQQKEIVSLIDYSFFTKLGILPQTSNILEKIQNLCSYFKVSNLTTLKEPDLLANFRTGIKTVEEKNIINANAWLQTAVNIGRDMDCGDFNEQKLKSYIPEIRSMTLQSPREFYPRLVEMFKDCGICFVLLPQLKNCGINGAVKWINKQKVVLAINDRMHYADVFWFSLFHEIKHVLQKKITKTIISGIYQTDIDATLEDEANLFSRNTLIPADKFNKYIQTSRITTSSIISFARSIDIHPGRVVGRLINEKMIHPSYYHDLRTKYQIRPISD